MSPTAVVLNNRYAVWALVIAALVFGLFSYSSIPVRLFPDTAPPLVNVATVWPGAAASDVSRDLGRVLEEEFASLQGVETLRSTSQDNLSLISIEFEYDTDVDLAAVEVSNAISRIGEDLPVGSERSRVMSFSTSDRPIYTVGLVGDDLTAARRLVEDVVAPRLQAVSGVAAVDVFGGEVPTVLVDVDPRLAEAHRIPLQRVAEAIRTTNVSVPAGRLRSTTTETMLRVDQRLPRVDALEDVPLQLADGAQLRVGDVATVARGAATDDAWFSIDGQRAIAVQVFRAEDANTVAVVDDVRAAVRGLENEFPSVQFVAGEESASFTEQSVANLLGNVGQALVLASLILLLFLGRARSAMIVAFTMPLSFGITFGFMQLLGMEFNMVTLSAVILAVGMVVDASVVVLENIVRLRDEEGLDPLQAAIRGTDEVQLPVLAGVATTLVVLIPLRTLPGFVGKVFGPLATTLLIAFLSSVVVALVVVPVLSLYARDGGRLDDWAARISGPFQAGMDRLRRVYLGLLDLGLRRPLGVLGLAVVSFLLGLGGLNNAGMNLLPKMDSGAFSIGLQTPSGSSLAQTAAVVSQVGELVRQHPEVQLVQSQAGNEPGMSFSGGVGVMGPTQGFVSVTLSPRTERDRSIWEIEDDVRRQVATVPGVAHVTVKEVGNTAKPTTVAPIVARISGPDPRVLDALGDGVVQALSGVDDVVEPIRTWHRDMRRVRVNVDDQRAAALGQSTLGVARLLASGAEGVDAGDFTVQGGSPEPVLVRYARTADPDVDELLTWPLFLDVSGQVVPLRAVAEANATVEQGLFTSEDLVPVLDVVAEVGDQPLSFVVADARAAMGELVLPEGYAVTLEGENNDLVESRVSILRALGVSIFAVYLLLVAQFRSFVHPLTVMMAVPLSLSGVAVALTVTGKPVSMPVMVGLVLLVGTVVNNSIILVDIIRQLRQDGMERRDALREGVRARFRPIMMTSLSTVVGMIPLAMEWALGAERFSPLATAVIGGLLASTLLTMVVIPVLYDVVDRVRLPRLRAGVVAATTVLLTFGALAPQSAVAQELTLEHAWALAMEDHPSVQIADAQLASARARSAAAVGRFLPEAQFIGRYSHLSYVEPPLIELPLLLPTGEAPDPIQLGEVIQDQVSLRLDIRQPLYAGGALRQGRKAAVASVDRLEADGDGARASLWISVVEAYHGVAMTTAVVDIQARVVAAASAQEQRMERLLPEGRATELQVASVALERSEAEQRLASATASARLARHRLALLVGEPAPEVSGDLVAAARGLDLAPEQGSTPQLRSVQAASRAASARAKAIGGSLLPVVSARFGYQYENPNTRVFPLRSGWQDSWDASLVLSWTLDAGVRASEATAARRDAEAAQAGVLAIEQQVELQLARALSDTQLATEQLRLATDRVAVGERAVRAAEVTFDSGRLTVVELLERGADLGNARAAQQRAAFDVLVATEQLRVLYGSYGPPRQATR